MSEIIEIIVSYSKNDDDTVRKQADQSLEHCAEYNIDIYFSGKNQAGFGPAPQISILAWLEALDTAAQQRNSSAIVALCEHLLSPTMGSTTWDYKTVTWSTASIPATDAIKDIRRRSLHLLKGLSAR